MEINLFSFLMIFLTSLLAAMGLGGGSLLMLCLVFFTDLSQPEAQALNLFLFLPTAAIALFLHRKHNLLRSNLLRAILLPGILGALIGSFFSSRIESTFLRKIFGIFLLLMALREFRTLWKEKQQKTPPPKA